MLLLLLLLLLGKKTSFYELIKKIFCEILRIQKNNKKAEQNIFIFSSLKHHTRSRSLPRNAFYFLERKKKGPPNLCFDLLHYLYIKKSQKIRTNHLEKILIIKENLPKQQNECQCKYHTKNTANSSRNRSSLIIFN